MGCVGGAPPSSRVGLPTEILLSEETVLASVEAGADSASGFASAFGGRSQSVAVIESGATALATWWARRSSTTYGPALRTAGVAIDWSTATRLAERARGYLLAKQESDQRSADNSTSPVG